MKREFIIGVDPGKSGGMVIRSLKKHSFIIASPFRDLATVISVLDTIIDEVAFVVLEKVHAAPAQGVSSAFTFGENYGVWQGIFAAYGVKVHSVDPQVWQKKMNCRSGGDKNVTKQKAQELFPGMKITHAVADALLISEFGLRTVEEKSLEANNL